MIMISSIKHLINNHDNNNNNFSNCSWRTITWRKEDNHDKEN